MYDVYKLVFLKYFNVYENVVVFFVEMCCS